MLRIVATRIVLEACGATTTTTTTAITMATTMEKERQLFGVA